MPKFPKKEIQKALDRYHEIRDKAESGKIGWEALADVFTEDATYIDAVWGRSVGREKIRKFLHDSMQGLDDWSFPIEWTMIGDNRVVIKFYNRLPGRRPNGTFYEVPGISILEYAGNGKLSLEHDLYDVAHLMEVVKESGWKPGPNVISPKKVVR